MDNKIPFETPTNWEDHMSPALTLSVFLTMILSSVQVLAADFPKTGNAEYDTYYVFEHVAKMDSGAGNSAITHITGITRNVKGEEPFNNMSVHCLMHWSMIKDNFSGAGSCVETDKDGDNIFTTFDDNNHYMKGGTGKYKGISGTVPYTVNQLHDTVSGRWASIVNHKASWEIK